MRKRKNINLSMSTKFSLVIISLLSTLGLSTMGVSYYIIKQSNLSSMDKSLYDTSFILSQTVDKELVKSSLKKPDKDNPDETLLTKQLDGILSKSKAIKNLYLISQVGNDFYVPSMSSNLLSAGVKLNQDVNSLGFSPQFIATIKATFSKKDVESTDIYGDQYGMYKTGLAPIFDRNGSLLAVYAVDYDVSQVTAKALREALNIFYVTMLFLIGSAIIGYFLIKRKLAPIQTISDISRQVAEGDLEVKIIQAKSKDEMGVLVQNFNLMIENLKDIIQRVKSVSSKVNDSSHLLSSNMEAIIRANNEMVASIQEVASGADTQVDNADQVTRVIEEMSSGIQRISISAMTISETSFMTAREAEKGNESTRKVVEQMDLISQTVNQSASLIKLLGTRSDEIGKIVEIITGIASQTNLLALNAAIEAARAGEYGRGFAVVADEVRKLAEQSQESARQISTIIEQIQTETSQSIDMMDKAVREVENGFEVVNEAESAFHHILTSIKDVADQIQEVSATFQEMSAGTEEVTRSVQQMEIISKNSRDNTKEVALATMSQLDNMQKISYEAEFLKELSEELQGAVKKFNLD